VRESASNGNARRTEYPGIILVFFGLIWFLQGINVLPGSFMTGQTRWAVHGAIAVTAGTALLLASNRRGLTGRR